MNKKEFLGEFIGTFLMVLFGCGAVAVTTLFGAHQGLFQIGIIWGISITLAIYITRDLSCAHFNPARDFAPRLVALLFGWGEWAMPDSSGGCFWVYFLAPIVGGLLASLLFTRVIEPAMKQKKTCCCK